MASLIATQEETETPTPLLELLVRELGPVGNRRTLPRVQSRFELLCDDGQSYHGVDLSFGGLMCVGDEPLWPGNTLSCRLVLNGDRQHLSVSGTVVELVPFRSQVAMRVRFDALPLATRKRIAAYMARVRGA